MREEVGAMNTVVNTPDAPFRSGTTGKYKLLIRSVSPKVDGYEYELVDADSREYKAISKEHYPDGQLLRCIVSFEVRGAKLVVIDTAVCKKQDLATLIPEPPKPLPKAAKKEPETHSKKASKDKTSSKPKATRLGDPRFRRASGMYVFRVADVKRIEEGFSYQVEDAKGNSYEVHSKDQYALGKLVDCKVSVSSAPSGLLKIAVLSIRNHIVSSSNPAGKHKKSGSIKHWHAKENSRDWLSGPNVGDHFHLIYTPMGNKR